jgi:hypothetical protein
MVNFKQLGWPGFGAIRRFAGEVSYLSLDITLLSESLLDMKAQENNFSESVELSAAASASPNGANIQCTDARLHSEIASLYGFRPTGPALLTRAPTMIKFPL